MTRPISSMNAQVILQCENPNHTKLLVSDIFNQADDNANIISVLAPMLKQAIYDYDINLGYENTYDFCEEAMGALDEELDKCLLFINYIKPGEVNITYPIEIEDLKPEGLNEEEILAEFDDWVRIIRDKIIERYRKGELPTGRDIVFAPNGLDYQTEYSNRKPREDEKKYLNRTHHDNFYYGEI